MFANLAVLFVYPIIAIQWIQSEIIPSTYFMLFASSTFLKLISFHHVMADNRNLIRRMKLVSPEQKTDAAFFNINEETFRIAINYPKNISLKHFIRFLVAPTFCY